MKKVIEEALKEIRDAERFKVFDKDNLLLESVLKSVYLQGRVDAMEEYLTK